MVISIGFTAHTVYSWKYWRELNLAVGSQIAIVIVLVDLNLTVRYAEWIITVGYRPKSEQNGSMAAQTAPTLDILAA